MLKFRFDRRISLNVAKTELMIVGSRQRLSVQNEDVERIDDKTLLLKQGMSYNELQ